MKKLLISAEKKLIFFEKIILIFFLALMVLLSFLQFFLRFFFSSGLLWMDSFLRYLVLNTAMFSAAYVSGNGSHFALEILSGKLPENISKLIGRAAYLFALFACILLFVSSLSFVKQEYLSDSNAFSAWGIQFKSFYLQLCLPLGFLFSSYHFLLKIFSTNQKQESQP